MRLDWLESLVCYTLAVLSAGSLPAAGVSSASSHCPDKSSRAATSFVQEHDGVCYEFHVDELTWKDANASCSQRRGSLVMIDSEAKQEFLAGVLRTAPAFKLVWIGASLARARGSWLWERTGRPLNYHHWLSGHPRGNDNTCSFMGREDAWRWLSTAYCESSIFLHSYICQYDERSSGGLLSNPNDIIGLAVGLSCAFVIILVVGGVLAWIHKRRRLRAERQRSYSGSSEQKISNIESGLNCELNSLNKCPAPPAYGQVTTLSDMAADVSPQLQLAAAAQVSLSQYEQQQQQLQQQQQQQQLQRQRSSLSQQHMHDESPDESDPLVSNLACHSSQASKLQDKCLLELFAQNSDPPLTNGVSDVLPAAATAASSSDAAADLSAAAESESAHIAVAAGSQPATPADSEDRADNGIVTESSAAAVGLTSPLEELSGSADTGQRLRLDQGGDDDEENEEAARLLRYNDLS